MPFRRAEPVQIGDQEAPFSRLAHDPHRVDQRRARGELHLRAGVDVDAEDDRRPGLEADVGDEQPPAGPECDPHGSVAGRRRRPRSPPRSPGRPGRPPRRLVGDEQVAGAVEDHVGGVDERRARARPRVAPPVARSTRKIAPLPPGPPTGRRRRRRPGCGRRAPARQAAQAQRASLRFVPTSCANDGERAPIHEIAGGADRWLGPAPLLALTGRRPPASPTTSQVPRSPNEANRAAPQGPRPRRRCRPRRTARRVRRLRHVRARPRGRPARLLRPLRASAPRPGVGGDRHLRGRPHHHPARHRARLPGLRRAEAAGARRRHGDRPRPLLDHRRRLVGELAAGLARRRARGRARPQRQPDQRGRALQRAARARDQLPRHAPTRRSSPHCSRSRRRGRSRTRSPRSCRGSRAPTRRS